MTLLMWCYAAACFFAFIFFVVFCIIAFCAGVVGLLLLLTPFPYFPKHRRFLVRAWTFAVTATFFEGDSAHKAEWEKLKQEMRQLASWESAKEVVKDDQK